jgi:hypothetical protein
MLYGKFHQHLNARFVVHWLVGHFVPIPVIEIQRVRLTDRQKTDPKATFDLFNSGRYVIFKIDTNQFY